MFVTECDLRVYKPREWIVLRDFVWRFDWSDLEITDPLLDGLLGHDELKEITVPRGFITDLASVPPPFRNLLDTNGTSRKAAVLHDWLYCTQRCDREQADRLFRFALMRTQTGPIARAMYYSGVRLGGWRYYGERREGLEREDFVPHGYWEKHP